jgi:hypothetical protein
MYAYVHPGGIRTQGNILPLYIPDRESTALEDFPKGPQSVYIHCIPKNQSFYIICTYIGAGQNLS